MAKELPYFKFEPNAWESGNIQMCSMEAQGLFINLCATYWSRLGELSVKLAKQKQCKGYASALQELIEEELIVEDNGFFVIQFLDEQLADFQNTSNKRRDAANKRWSKKPDASSLQKQSKSNAIRGDKKKGEKKIEEYRRFAHLSISIVDYDKLISEGFTKQQLDLVMDNIENYKKNTNYSSLNLTVRAWLKRDNITPIKTEKKRSMTIAERNALYDPKP